MRYIRNNDTAYFSTPMYMSLVVCVREVVRHWQKHVANVQNDFIFFCGFEESPNLAPEKRNEQYKGGETQISTDW